MATDDRYEEALKRYFESGNCRHYKKYDGKSCIRDTGIEDEECRCSAGFLYLNDARRLYGYKA